MELVILLIVVGIVLAIVLVAHRTHAKRYWSNDSESQLSHQLARTPQPSAPPRSFDEQEVFAFVERLVAEKWREGFLSEDDVINWVADAVEDEYPGSNAIETIEESLIRAIATFRLEQESWPPVTDCDRLTSIFTQLDRAGIVSAENFSCCNNCGHGEMLAEMNQEQLSRPVRGYAFYHAQDTERATQGAGLYIRYGTDRQDEEASVQVGREIFEAFVEAAFAPQWNGSSTEAIFVPINWQKRRSAA